MNAEDVAGLLMGSGGTSVTRTLDMGEVGFRRADGAEVSLHLQCPFRVLHAGTTVLGSADMQYPETGDRAAAFAQYTTVFDARAKVLTGILEARSPEVLEVELGTAGRLDVRLEGDLEIEVFPDCSGVVEAWRVFRRGGGPHLGYPAGAL
ncbi:hypothetical protein ACIA49_19105 [Kribbella sp. NPDC051587]|uniref:hypothetical protein n=1 Tax=Kribbella sp. NPDC051587 TaxID=3364119 RepID=UPI00379C409E